MNFMFIVLVNDNLWLFNEEMMFTVWYERFVIQNLTWFYQYRFVQFYLFVLDWVFRKTSFDIKAD